MNIRDKNVGDDLTRQEFWILTSLLQSPKHGYAISKQVADISDGKVKLSAGTLYENIHRMLESGLLERDGEHDVEPGTRRKRYRATGLGEAAHKEHVKLMDRAVKLIPGYSR